MADQAPYGDLFYWREGIVVPFPIDRVRAPLGPQRVELLLRAERRLAERQAAGRRATPRQSD